MKKTVLLTLAACILAALTVCLGFVVFATENAEIQEKEPDATMTENVPPFELPDEGLLYYIKQYNINDDSIKLVREAIWNLENYIPDTVYDRDSPEAKEFWSRVRKLVEDCCAYREQNAAEIHAAATGKTPLYELSDEKLSYYIEQYDIVVASIEDARKSIWAVENIPNKIHDRNSLEAEVFWSNVRKLVNDYYSSDEQEDAVSEVAGSDVDVIISASAAGYTLVNSKTLYPTPFEDEMYYNCYAYALLKTDGGYNPGFGLVKGAGFTSNQDIKNYTALVWAQRAKSDIISALGYNCVSIVAAKPTWSTSKNIICVRAGDSKVEIPFYENGEYKNAIRYDYHFMRLYSDGWRHKPGASTLLLYLHSPEKYEWTNEGIFYYSDTGKWTARAPDTYYYGSLYYIVYKTSHGTVKESMVNDYHLGSKHYYVYNTVCSDCGIISTRTTSQACSGPPCPAIVYSTEPEESKE